MKLSIEFKPTSVTGSHNGAILSKIRGTRFSHMVTSNGSFLCNTFAESANRTVRVYSIEKRRKKVKRVLDKLDNKNVRSEVISRGCWVGYFYDIPFSIIKTMNLCVTQGTRTFTITGK